MFREMRRRKQGLNIDICETILKEEKRGVLAVSGDSEYPYAIPVDFYYDPDKNAVYIHSAKAGHKIDAIKNNNKVCFTIWNQGTREGDDWSYHVDSVIAFGRAIIVESEEERHQMTKRLGMKYYPCEEDVEAEIKRDLDRMLLIRIDIEHMTGKHVHEK